MWKNCYRFDFKVILNVHANHLKKSANHNPKKSVLFWESILRDDDDEDEDKITQGKNKSMLSYISASTGGNNQNTTHPTHRFFTDRRLKSLSTL